MIQLPARRQRALSTLKPKTATPGRSPASNEIGTAIRFQSGPYGERSSCQEPANRMRGSVSANSSG